MKIKEAKRLAEKYGQKTTLEELVKIIQANKTNICPQCHGTGILLVQCKVNHRGLPTTIITIKNECWMCKGEGYIERNH